MARGERKSRQRAQSTMAHEEQVAIVKYQTPGHFGRHVLEQERRNC